MQVIKHFRAAAEHTLLFNYYQKAEITITENRQYSNLTERITQQQTYPYTGTQE